MKVQVNEFRKNLKKYLDLLEKGEVIEVRGVRIAKTEEWFDDKGETVSVHRTMEFPVGKGVYTDPQTVEKESKKSTKGKLNVHKDKNGVKISMAGGDVNYYGASQIEIHTCEKCKKPNNECYRLWEEGEERIVCIDCIKKSVSSKMLKSYLRKLNKL